MSNEIEIGDTVLRVGPTVGSCVHGREYKVTDAHPGEIKIAGPPGWWSVSKFEPVRIPDATPAPLDPSKVKAGDTVTLDHPDGTHIPDRTVSSVYAIMIGRRQEYLNDLYAEGYTLTAHQPAPEPEPEWKSGTVGTATLNNLLNGATRPGVRVMRFETQSGRLGFVNEHGDLVSDDSLDVSVSDFVPDETRPLPTREQIAVAIARADSHESQSNLYLKNADAVLALLRGESR